jgi:DNA gyrase/topoisomerase IV subunit B
MSYSAEQVTKALLALAANAGDAKATAKQLNAGDFKITEATLLLWKHEEHAERYKRLETELAHERERRTVSVLQETIVETSRIKKDLLAKVEKTADRAEYAGHALRAITDAESKSTNNLLALTGRPTDGRAEGGAEAMVRLVEGMHARGLISMAPGLQLEPQQVPNEAEAG